MEASLYEGEPEVPISAILHIDGNVKKALPKCLDISTPEPHDPGFWTRVARLNIVLPNGEEAAYFLKVAYGDCGKSMMFSEHASMSAIYNTMPSLVPKPVACGSYESDPLIHFFLCEFHNFSEELPDIDIFCEKLAALHRYSKSPTGQFGFEVPTYCSNLPQHTLWTSSWETFFSTALESMLEQEMQSQGPSETIDEMRDSLFTKVVPRLLRPLETNGRYLKPSLVHGDLWFGNTAMTVTGEPKIFDACSFYAHNEYDLGAWRPHRNRFGKPYFKKYHRHLRIAEPIEDYEDRITLYSICFNMRDSALYAPNKQFREMMIEDIQSLVKKFSDGYEEPKLKQ